MEISVIVPIYNSEKYIKRAIQCLHKQKENDIEFLLIDDGSKDDTLIITKQTLDKIKDNRFKLKSKVNTGYGDTINFGISIASGKFVGIYEPDDLIEKTFYSELNKNKVGVDIVKYNGLYVYKNKTKEILFRYSQKEIENEKLLTKRLLVAHPSIINGIYKKEFLENRDIKFCTGGGASYQDEQFRVSLSYCNPKIKIINKCKYIYIQHKDQSVRKSFYVIKDVLINWQDEYQWIKKHGFSKTFFALSCYREYESLKKRYGYTKYNKQMQDFIKKISKNRSEVVKVIILMIKLKIKWKTIFNYINLMMFIK